MLAWPAILNGFIRRARAPRLFCTNFLKGFVFVAVAWARPSGRVFFGFFFFSRCEPAAAVVAINSLFEVFVFAAVCWLAVKVA